MKTERDPKEAPTAVPKEPAKPDRRRCPRCRCSLPLTIHCADGAAMPGISVEMSEGGMSAMVNGLLKAGDRVELELVAGSRVAVQVRYKLGQLYGFAFVELTAEQAQKIAMTCQKYGIPGGTARRD